MEVIFKPRMGFAFVTDGGDIDELAQALNVGIVRHMPPPQSVSKVRGAVRAFSFHWSNAQGAWDVIPLRDFPWGIDGAEFIVFMGRDALSPLGKPWSLAEMRYVAKKLAHHPGFGFSMRANALTNRWLAAAVAWSGPTLYAATVNADKVLKTVTPGTKWFHTSKGMSQYSYRDPEPSGFIRYEVADRMMWGGIFAVPEIAFQAGWDVARKKFQVTSFREELSFTTPERLLAFMSDATKMAAFIRKGLKTIDPGLAALYTGKVTPDGMVNRVLEVKASFDVVDEWHSTTLNILLMLRTAKPVPNKLIETWLKAHWAEVLKLAPSKTPKPAPEPSRYASWDDDDDLDDSYDDDDEDWKMDHPAPGLGWLVPNQMAYSQIEGFNIQQTGNRATVSAHAAIR